MTIYIAGPMGNIEDYNNPAFFRAEKALKAKGWNVLNPAKIPDIGNKFQMYWPINTAMLDAQTLFTC